jgi:hypothetical protein
MLVTSEAEHAVFRPQQQEDGDGQAGYRATVFVPDETGAFIVPAFRAGYGEPPKRIEDSRAYFRKGDPLVGAAWARPNALRICHVPCLAECNNDERAWRRAWRSNLKVTEDAALRMNAHSAFTPHVRSIATYAIHLSEESELVIVLESTRRDGFEDRWISSKVTSKKTDKFGVVLARLIHLIIALEKTIVETSDRLSAAPLERIRREPASSLPAPPRSSERAPVSRQRRSPTSSTGSLDSDLPPPSPPRHSATAPKPGLAQSDGVAAQIFISHAHEDEELARRVLVCLHACLHVEKEAIRCTSAAGHGLRVGADVRLSLRDDLRAAPIIIGLLTPAGARSPWVQAELSIGWGSDKLVCCLLGGVDQSELSPVLDGIHKLELSDYRSIRNLVHAITRAGHCERREGEGRDHALSEFDEFCRSQSFGVKTAKKRKRAIRPRSP